jgi:hypothetical protein
MAHAIAIGLHVLCCGIPIIASGVSVLTGVALSGAFGPLETVHHWLHGHEWTLAAVSGAFVLAGFIWDRHERAIGHRGAGLWLGVSVVLFAANLSLTALHHIGVWPPHSGAEITVAQTATPVAEPIAHTHDHQH